MPKNTGTLITAPIRPNDSLDPIATAYSSEIKGGVHTVQNISDRDSIILQRRDWGMLCYVINDDKYYILKYNHYNDDITDNRNWVEFDYCNISKFWLEPVNDIINTAPQNSQNGDRYIVGVNATGIWSGRNKQIAQWNGISNRWDYIIPLNGATVRIKNLSNRIYRYDGDYPSGNWLEETSSSNNIIYDSLYEYININIYDFNLMHSVFIASSVQNITELSPRHIYVLNYNYNLNSNYTNLMLKIGDIEPYFIYKYDIIENKTIGVSSSDFVISNTYYLKWLGDYFILFDENPYTQEAFKYTNLVPSESIGSLKKHTIFNNVNIYDILDSIITPIGLNGDIDYFDINVDKMLEVGDSINTGDYIFSFKINNPSLIQDDSISIEDYTNNIILSDNISKTQLSANIYLPHTITYTSKAEHIFIASAKKIDGSIIKSKPCIIKWVYRTYYGSSPRDINTITDIKNLSNSILSETCKGNFFINGNGYKYIVVVSDYANEINRIIDYDTNLCVVWADEDDGYNVEINNRLYAKLITLTNDYGVDISYCIFRTKYIINSDLNIVIE